MPAAGAWTVRNTVRLARSAASELADVHPRRGKAPLPDDSAVLALRAVVFDVSGVGTIHGWYAPTHNGAAVILATQVAAVDRRVRAVALAAPPGDAVVLTRRDYAARGPVAQWGALLGLHLGGMRLDDPQAGDAGPPRRPRPLLIISGTADRAVTPAMARPLYAAAGEPKRLWLIENAGHGGYERALRSYGAHVPGLFDEALAPPAPSTAER
ncbi:hypothetical protein tb265_43870 [Gemmatimonadetes bacterium T265]|nr:hypothetical protein tb265_43870 [Gemmatimonadetes bacterium T265]